MAFSRNELILICHAFGIKPKLGLKGAVTTNTLNEAIGDACIPGFNNTKEKIVELVQWMNLTEVVDVEYADDVSESVSNVVRVLHLFNANREKKDMLERFPGVIVTDDVFLNLMSSQLSNGPERTAKANIGQYDVCLATTKSIHVAYLRTVYVRNPNGPFLDEKDDYSACLPTLEELGYTEDDFDVVGGSDDLGAPRATKRRMVSDNPVSHLLVKTFEVAKEIESKINSDAFKLLPKEHADNYRTDANYRKEFDRLCNAMELKAVCERMLSHNLKYVEYAMTPDDDTYTDTPEEEEIEELLSSLGI